jgi:hypothetical protein
MSTISAGNTLTTGFVSTSDTTGNLVFQTNGTTTALTISTSQNANFVGSVSAVNTFGFENRIINGGMTIDQRYAGTATANTISGYTVDRWAVQQTTPGKLIAQQNAGSVTPPTGFTKYLGVTSQSAYTVAAGDFYPMYQVIEGNNVADLAWGTASAKTITLSFWVRSSLTGTFGGSLRNAAGNRSYPFSYTINSANTWEYETITITGDTTGTWATDNTGGIWVYFGLGVGSTYSGTAGAWVAGNFFSTTGAVSVVGTNGATFYITGVQFEVGTQATSFDFRDYGRELILCQRYYQKSYEYAIVPGTAVNNENAIQQSWGVAPTGSIASSVFPLAVVMRTSPTLVLFDVAGNSGKVTGLGAGSEQTQNVNTNTQNATSARVYVRMYAVAYYGISYMFTVSAEL